jgi:hypothetical protein
MIHYQLRCSAEHEFDMWFRDSAAFEAQSASGFVECPACGDTKVSRALMAPAVPRKGNARKAIPAPQPQPPAPEAPPAQQQVAVPPPNMPAEMRAMLQKLRAEVEKRCDYVGPDFAEEARRIHRGESDRTGIYGEATSEQTEALADEGIDVAKIPWVPLSDA